MSITRRPHCSWTKQITEPNHTFPFLPGNRYHHHPISIFYRKHLHLYTIAIAALPYKWPRPTTVRLNAGKIHVTSSTVISNIDDMKIYTILVFLTALLNILRHFCKSIDLLVSSALQATTAEHWALSEKWKKEKWHIHSQKPANLWILLCPSSLWDCLIQMTSPYQVICLLISRMAPIALWSAVCFVYGVMWLFGGCLGVIQ